MTLHRYCATGELTEISRAVTACLSRQHSRVLLKAADFSNLNGSLLYICTTHTNGQTWLILYNCGTMYDRYDKLKTRDNDITVGRSCYYDIFLTTDEVCCKFKTSYHSNTNLNKTINSYHFYKTKCVYRKRILTNRFLYSDFELNTSILNTYVTCCNGLNEKRFQSSFSANVCYQRKTIMRKRWKQCTTNLPDIIYNNIKQSIGMGLLLSFLALLLPSGVSTLQPNVLHGSSTHSTPSVEIDQFKTKEFNTDHTKDKDISRLVDRSEGMIRAQDEEEPRIWPSESAAKRKIQS